MDGFSFAVGCSAGLVVASVWRYMHRDDKLVNKWRWMARRRWYRFYQRDYHKDD